MPALRITQKGPCEASAYYFGVTGLYHVLHSCTGRTPGILFSQRSGEETQHWVGMRVVLLHRQQRFSPGIRYLCLALHICGRYEYWFLVFRECIRFTGRRR